MFLKIFSVIKKIIIKIILSVSTLAILPILLVARVFFKYKIGIIRVDRLGHLALNTDLFFRRIQLGTIPLAYRYYLLAPRITSQQVANSYLLTMFKRFGNKQQNVRIITNSILYFIFGNMRKHLAKCELLYELEYRSNEVEFSITKQSLYFTKEEINYGNNELKILGIQNRKQKVVCIYARDNAYLEEIDKNIDWKYHNYRNMDVDTYIDAIKYLISKEYKVIRIGSIVNKAVNFTDANFYDYSVSDHRTEFLDLFLVARSEFIVGSSSGATDIAELFKVPFLAVNFAPCIGSPLGKNDLYMPKKYVDINNNDKVIPFKNVIKIDSTHLYQGDMLQKNYGLSYIDNTPEEILSAVIEMEQRISGEFTETHSDKLLLHQYFEEFWKNNPKAKVKTNICLEWLRCNQSLYF